MPTYLDKLAEIDTFILDVDGVLTDGKVYITPDNKIMRSMHTKDGLAVKHAIDQGYRVVIISGGRDENILPRLKNLGVKDIFLHTTDKRPVMEQYLTRHGIDPSRVAYMGDDIPDIPPMRYAGLAVCPANAAPEVKETAHWIIGRNGGDACVRELIEKVMKVRGDWFPGLFEKD